MKRIQLYSIGTDHYRNMFNLFKQSFGDCSNKFDINFILEKELSDGRFMMFDFKKLMIKKLGLIIKTIEQNYGELIIWSDCDILCLKDPYDEIVNSISGCDLAAMDEGNMQYENHCEYLNIGFLTIRCNSKMKTFFEDLLQFCFKQMRSENIEKTELFTQGPFNILLKDPQGIRYSTLPDSFFCYHRNEFGDLKENPCSWDSLKFKTMVHFTGVFDCEGKEKNRILEKEEKMRKLYDDFNIYKSL